MAALVSPVNRKRGDIKWGLVAHTAVMFLFVTVYITITLYVLSTSYIDNREFPGVNGLLPPGPLGYQYFTYANAINVVPTLMFLLNNWLADGLLVSLPQAQSYGCLTWFIKLYRCYVVYTMNYLVIAFPCLMYLASLGACSNPPRTDTKLSANVIDTATGITFICKVSRPTSTTHISANLKTIGLPHNSISVSLNVLLTLMVVVRLMLHNKEIRKAMGTSTTNGGLHKAIVTMLVQSCALYTVNFVLFIGLWAVNNPIANTFFPILIQTQVRTVLPFS